MTTTTDLELSESRDRLSANQIAVAIKFDLKVKSVCRAKIIQGDEAKLEAARQGAISWSPDDMLLYCRSTESERKVIRELKAIGKREG